MARSSRHKSHRSHKHRDRSDSEEDGNSRERKQRSEEEELVAAGSSGARVSTVSEQEKRKSSSKDEIGASNGDLSADHSKKRKDRSGDSAVGGDRWNGGGDDDIRADKESNKEGSDAVDLEKSSNTKISNVDLKGKSSSRRQRSPSEKNEEKGRSEKDVSRRESSSQYKDEKEREKDKKVQDCRHERSDGGMSRKEERLVKQDMEISGLQDEMRNPELEKELDKRMKKRRDGSSDHNKWEGDGREGDVRHISSRDDHSKTGSYKDGRYKEKYREVLDRDERHRDDKHRDEHSRVHTNERSDSKHYRDENRLSESHYKKTKLQESDRDGSRHEDDRGAKLKDNRGRKRSSDENEDYSNVKPRCAKEPRGDTSKNGSSSSKLDSRSDRSRLEHSHLDKVDSSFSNSRPKSSPSCSAYAVTDANRHNSRQAESRRESLSEETRRSGTVSRDHATALGGRERISESRSLEKSKLKDEIHSDVISVEATAVSHHDRIPRSDARKSPNQLTEKSPSRSERRSERNTTRSVLDLEVGQKSSSSKGARESSFTKDNGREQEYLVEKSNMNDCSQVELLKAEPVSVGSSSYNRAAQLQGSSPGQLPPPPPVRFGVDSPSVLGSYEDETRIYNGDRKTNSRYKRIADVSVGRGQGSPWKSSPTWPSPVANGFMPLQHGPPARFHPSVQQFPAPPLFGVRPSMDLNHTSYHVHEAANRFSAHARPYRWHNPVDDCSPHLQLWDGNNNLFGDESHIYGRQDWDQNRHLMNNRGWEMSADMWNGQNGNVNMEFPVAQKEQEHSRDEKTRAERSIADAIGMKLDDISPAKKSLGTSKSQSEKTHEPSTMPSLHGASEKQSDYNVRFCCNYLSKLDISLDLVQPELYKQCMSLVGTRDGIVAGNVSEQEKQKNNKEEARVVAKSKQYALNSFFPTATDATFQKAMSLYKKQKEGMKEVIRPTLPLCSEELNKPPEADVEKLNASSTNNVEEDLPLANAVSADYMDRERKATANADGLDPGDTQQPCDKPGDTAQQCDSPDDGEEQQCDRISDAVVFREGSEESEALIPECRVNLSRIHLSPESTH